MNPTERIMAVLEGKTPDRVQTFYPAFDEYPTQQVMGKPLISGKTLFINPVAEFIFNRWGRRLTNALVNPVIDAGFLKALEAAVKLGFDVVWAGPTDGQAIIWDGRTLARPTGSFYDLTDDGHGNVYYMYKEPAIPSQEAFDAWPHFPHTDDVANKSYTFQKKSLKKFGDRICIMPQVIGIHETMVLSIGFVNMAVHIRRRAAFIQRFIDYLEEYAMKLCMAMMDAGIKVILLGDDFSNKSGPSMNPVISDKLFGEPYTRITRAVHDRGGKIIIHSCGDNTKMFDYFIKWGFDGGHAYENTSNVDIFQEKKIHGDRFTIVGGVGVDYLLTDRSRPEEVEENVKTLIRELGPGSRFIIGPVHTHPDLDMSKVKIMLETVKRYGGYPISV